MTDRPDFEEIITTTEQLKNMVENFVPTMMRPSVFPGFVGVQCVTNAWMKEQLKKASPSYIEKHLENSEDEFTMLSLVTDLADWYRAADMDPPQETMWVIFLREGESWGYTYFSLLSEIFRVIAVTEQSEEYAASEAAISDSNKKAAKLCKKIFPDDYKQILGMVSETLKKVKRIK
jgi:hypothetical protein